MKIAITSHRSRLRTLASSILTLGFFVCFWPLFEIRVHAVAPGDLDTAFGAAGTVLTSVPGGGWARALVKQPDGKIVAGGVTGWITSGPPRFCLIRYNPDGSLDSSFGSGGIVLSSIGNQGVGPLVLQPDGKIIAGTTFQQNFLIVRYLSDGNLDSSFGSGGVATISIGLLSGIGGMVLTQDGKLVIGGWVREGTVSSPLALRIQSDGSPDFTFGTSGRTTVSFAPWSAQATSIIQLPDGRLILGATAIDPANELAARDFAVARLLSNGMPDTTFGNGGQSRLDVPGSADHLTALARQADGKLIVGGFSRVFSPSTPFSFSVCRLHAEGSLDTTFAGGLVYVVINSSESLLRNILIQSNGKVLATGNGSTPPTGARAFVRFLPNGSLDPEFGTNGIALRQSGHSGEAAILQDDGKIVIAGGGPSDSFSVSRYLGDAVVPIEKPPFDFDGDGKTDVGIFRPNGPASEWWINRSGNGQTFALQFGASTDKIAPADYTGDGKADIAFFRPTSGEWYVLRSEDFSFFALPFGANGDVPVPADYDADGKADFAVFRPSSSTWFVSQSSGAPTQIFQFGVTGDVPVVADYDGDGKADVGIFRQTAGGAEWWINRSTAGSLALQFGANTDKPVQGDYTGDGKADIATWRPSDGTWLILRSEDFSFFGFPFGANGDVLAAGDYDGDGKFDPTVFRPSSATWFIARTTAGTQIVQFGANGDRPIPNAFVP